MSKNSFCALQYLMGMFLEVVFTSLETTIFLAHLLQDIIKEPICLLHWMIMPTSLYTHIQIISPSHGTLLFG